ncbi:MAG: haloacid dehalogenase-like hydrolase [Anaerolineae bacterium]|nr:haloacid dehalogenase-like hydrolase [Anaerolineae bacterium]
MQETTSHATIPLVVACDVEGTLTTGHTWEGMRDYLVAHGGEGAYRRFFRRSLPALLLYRLGIGDPRAFKEKWLYGLLALYEGYTEEQFAAPAEHTAVEALWAGRRPVVIGALREHHAEGATIALASGVFQPILDALVACAAANGLPGLHAFGTPLEIVDGRLTGRTAIPFTVGAQKVAALSALAGEVPLAAAYGDTAADLPMLRASRRPIAVAPDAALRAAATENGWEIIGDE